MDTDVATYLLLAPPNHNAEHKRLEITSFTDFLDGLSTFNMPKTTHTQGTQVSFEDRIKNIGIIHGETQTEMIEKIDAATDAIYANQTDFSCNAVVTNIDMETMTEQLKNLTKDAETQAKYNEMEFRTILGKRSQNVVLPMQRGSNNSQTSNSSYNKRAIFEMEMKFLECHLMRLQNFMKYIAREKPSRTASFASRYANYIFDIAIKLSTAEDIIKVMEEDRINLAKNFEQDPLWDFTSEQEKFKGQSAPSLSSRNTSEDIHVELKETSQKRRREIPTAANNTDKSDVNPKRGRFEDADSRSETLERVVISSADITPINSAPKTATILPRQSQKIKQIAHYDIELFTPVTVDGRIHTRSETPLAQLPEEMKNSSRESPRKPFHDGRPNTPTEPHPTLVPSPFDYTNRYFNNSSNNKIRPNHRPIHDRGLYKHCDVPLDSLDSQSILTRVQGKPKTPPVEISFQQKSRLPPRDPRLQSRSRRTSQDDQTAKLRHWEHDAQKSSTSLSKTEPLRHWSKSSNLERLYNETRTPPMPNKIHKAIRKASSAIPTETDKRKPDYGSSSSNYTRNKPHMSNRDLNTMQPHRGQHDKRCDGNSYHQKEYDYRQQQSGKKGNSRQPDRRRGSLTDDFPFTL